MKYIVYQIRNELNGKTYIGIHRTQDIDDGYMGSGKNIQRAIKKYGLENFTKTILHVFDNEQDMIDKEIELVTEEFCSRKDTYNMCPGGKGGFGYIRNHKDYKNWQRKGALLGAHNERKDTTNATKRYLELLEDDEWREEAFKNNYKNFLGKKHTDKTKKKMSEAASKRIKDKNSQYGTMWITNGNENRKIKKVDSIPKGWYKGRVIRMK